MKYGLVLEGGGAKGAYHIGAVKALYENGYKFDAVVGTSIGAINAAIIAQGDLDKAYELWYNCSFSSIFDVEDKKIQKMMDKELDLETLKYLSKQLSNLIKEKGIETLKIRKLLEERIQEDKLRKSDIKFGLVTYCMSDANGLELFIDDIKKGELIDYIMASSNLPLFKKSEINNKRYIDGGVYDNCPVNMLEKIGIQDAIVIRTYKINRIRGYRSIVKRGNIKMHMLQPVDSLSSILNFDTKNLREELLLGYYDALKMIKKLDGIRYYIVHQKNKDILERIENIDYDKIVTIAKEANIDLEVGKNITDILKKKIIVKLARKTKNRNLSRLKDYVFAILEHIAIENNIEKYKIYTFDEFLKIVKDSLNEKNDKAMSSFIKAL